jgi:hypothetical protein
MVCHAITAEAFDAVAATLSLSSVAHKPEVNAKDERLLWVERVWVDKLAELRGPTGGGRCLHVHGARRTAVSCELARHAP